MALPTAAEIRAKRDADRIRIERENAAIKAREDAKAKADREARDKAAFPLLKG